jgi:hypothetical protein
MSRTSKPPGYKLGSMLLSCLFMLVLIGTFAHAQAGQKQPPNSAPGVSDEQGADSIAKAREDTPESIYYVEEIARQGQVEAVPMLEEKFGRTKDALDRGHIASALVRLGDRNDPYWNFLVKEARAAIESGMPDFGGYDPQGNSVPGPSPEFTAWAQAHNLSLAAAQDRVRVLGGAVTFLAITRDPRAIPLLRQALSVPSYIMQTQAAYGLVSIPDPGSIPLIIDACKRAPAEARALIATSLVYFDDPEAQSAVDKYVTKDMAKALREGRAKGKKTPWD